MSTSSKKNDSKEENENLFSELLFRYLPYWPLFLFLLIFCSACAFLYVRYATPIYETTATLLVKDEKKGVDDSNLMEQLDLFGSKKLVENEIEIIQSKTLMSNVARELTLYAPVFYKGTVVSNSAYRISPVIIEHKSPDSLIEVEKEYFSYDSASRSIVLNSKRHKLYDWFSDSGNVIRFLPNPNYLAPEKPKPLFFSLIPVNKIVSDLEENLKISQATKLSSVIDLSLKDAIPKRGEDILNHLLSQYNNAALADKNQLALNTIKFVDERLSHVSGELDSVEGGIQKYKTQQGIVDISAQGEQYLESVSANDLKLSEVSVQLSVMDQVEKYVRSKNDQPGIVPSTFGVDDPVLAQLLATLYQLETQYVGLKKTTAENNPILLSLKDQIDKMKPSILENISSLRRNLEAGKGNLGNTSERYSSVLHTLPQKERKLVEISRQQMIKNSIYSFLLQKREETALTYYSTINDSRIVDAASTTVKPISPKKVVIAIAALFGTFLLGIGIVTLRDGLSQHIIFRKEIEHFTSVPILGEIVHEPSENPIVIDERKHTYISEQFRQIRTSLSYLGINSRKKKLLITSSMGGEGKSFFSGNLGLSLALTDKKIVLIELDLRKPKLSKMFGITREVGITNYFIGNKEADEIIKQTKLNPNLYVIPCGAIPPNPSELILNGRLEKLLEYLESIFDYIIIDTAPVSPVTDAYILSPFCDATLYMVRHAVTPKHFIKHLDDNLQVKGLKNLALIFNGVKTRGLTKYEYGSGYGYSHSSAYGGYVQEEEKPGIIARVFGKKKVNT